MVVMDKNRRSSYHEHWNVVLMPKRINHPLNQMIRQQRYAFHSLDLGRINDFVHAMNDSIVNHKQVAQNQLHQQYRRGC